jgi:hypothetical protein
MNNALKNKLYQQEVPPPAYIWEQLFISLDQQSLQKEIADKLHSIEINPPDTAWVHISNTLDTNIYMKKIQDKVLNLEEQPPSLTWTKIAEQLDRQHTDEFSKRLYQYEITPVAKNWQRIVSVLDGEKETAPVIPLYKRYSRLFRIAVAAALIGFIVWAGFNLLNSDKTDNKLANNETKTKTGATAPPPKTNTDSIPVKIMDVGPLIENNNQPALVNTTSKTSKRPKKINSKEQGENVQAFVSTDSHSGADEIAVADTETLHKKNKPVTNTSDNNGEGTEARYLVYINEQGDMKKISKKLADLKCIYITKNDVNQDALAKLDASQCNEQVKFWQEKMANSSLQSSSNPLELIEILK